MKAKCPHNIVDAVRISRTLPGPDRRGGMGYLHVTCAKCSKSIRWRIGLLGTDEERQLAAARRALVARRYRHNATSHLFERTPYEEGTR